MEQVEKKTFEDDTKILDTETIIQPQGESKFEKIAELQEIEERECQQTSGKKKDTEVEMKHDEREITNELFGESKSEQVPILNEYLSRISTPVDVIFFNGNHSVETINTVKNSECELKSPHKEEAIKLSKETLTSEYITNAAAIVESEEMLEDTNLIGNNEQKKNIDIESSIVIKPEKLKEEINLNDKPEAESNETPTSIEADNGVLFFSAATSTKNGTIDDKSEGIFLETTNETINLESTQEDDDKDNSVVEKETVDEENDAISNENTEILTGSVANADTSIKTEPTQTTPKIQKKKAKTSTPNKYSINDVQASQKRRKKDPSAPKAPLNGYLVYFNDERAEMRMKNPNMGFGELTKIIALKWKDLPVEEKQKFITEADMDKERYVKEMAEYKKSESYKNYVKESSQAKMARNDNLLNNSHSFDDLNSFTIANESNIAGFDIPIFSEEFIEHSKSRENEMRLVRKEISELEQQNSVLHKHIEIMKQSSVKLDTDIDRFQNTNNQLKKKMDAFRQTVINCNIQLPNTMEFPNPNNIDDYIMRLYQYVANNQNQNDLAFINHVKGVLSKINFTSLFE